MKPPKRNRSGVNRMQRIAELIQTALAEILQRDAKQLHLGMITVTSVTVSKDLSFAKVFVSVLEDEKAEETLVALNKATKYLRYCLAHSIELRVTPELRFFYDDSIVRGHRISSLIHDSLKDQK